MGTDTVKSYAFAKKSYSRKKADLWHNKTDKSSGGCADMAAGQNCAKNPYP